MLKYPSTREVLKPRATLLPKELETHSNGGASRTSWLAFIRFKDGSGKEAPWWVPSAPLDVFNREGLTIIVNGIPMSSLECDGTHSLSNS